MRNDIIYQMMREPVSLIYLKPDKNEFYELSEATNYHWASGPASFKYPEIKDGKPTQYNWRDHTLFKTVRTSKDSYMA